MLYRAPYIGDNKTKATRVRPAGTDGIEWSAIDIRPDSRTLDGYCLLSSPSVISDKSVVLLADNFDSIIKTADKTNLDTALGVTVPNVVTAADLVRELLINDFDKWQPIQPSESTGIQEIWLGDEKIFSEQVATAKRVIMDPSDNFTGSDGADLVATNANWTYSRGAFLYDGNAVYPTGGPSIDTGAFYSGASFGNDHYSQATLAALGNGTYIGVLVRGSGDGTGTNQLYYLLYSDSADAMYFGKINAGNYSDIHSPVAVTAAGHVLKLGATGTSLSYEDNGSPIISPVTDTLIPSGGAPGISGYSNSNVSRLDDWSGANIAGASFQAAWARHSNMVLQ